MFRSDAAQSDLNGFLDAGSHVQGELRFEKRFRIDGTFTGRVVSDGILEIGERGFLNGEAAVGQVFVSGKVEGKVTAATKVEIASTGKVQASLRTPSLVIEDGALFEGQCAMSQRAGSRSAAESTGGAKGSGGASVTQLPLSKER